jgi:hypothetical protein
MEQYKEYKLKVLKGSLPENTEWWTDEDWKQHAELVEILKAKGEYLQEQEVTVRFLHNPTFDESKFFPTSPTESMDRESFRFFFLDMGDMPETTTVREVLTQEQFKEKYGMVKD